MGVDNNTAAWTSHELNGSIKDVFTGMKAVHVTEKTKESRDYSICVIGVGRFRILGDQGLEYWGAKGGNSQQAHDVVTTLKRRHDVASTSFRRHVLTRSLRNQCQIISFLILKSDIIKNSRIKLRGIVLPVPSNQIKVIFIIILPFILIHL